MSQDRVITRLKLGVKRLEKKRKARTPQPMKRRLFKGRVESSDDDLDEEDASKQGRESDKTKTDFASWKQRIRLYCQGKDNGVNILKSIDDGPFQMGTIRDPIAEGTEHAQQLGPERARVYSDLSPEDKCNTPKNVCRIESMSGGVTS
ncbi:hypothetical protein Tco_1371476 [Tanacetum coccineum]